MKQVSKLITWWGHTESHQYLSQNRSQGQEAGTITSASHAGPQYFSWCSLPSHLNTPWNSEAFTGCNSQAQAQQLPWSLLHLTQEDPSILHSFCAQRRPLQPFQVQPTVPAAFICCYQKPWTWCFLILGPKDSGLESPQPSQSLPERVRQPSQLRSLQWHKTRWQLWSCSLYPPQQGGLGGRRKAPAGDRYICHTQDNQQWAFGCRQSSWTLSAINWHLHSNNNPEFHGFCAYAQDNSWISHPGLVPSPSTPFSIGTTPTTLYHSPHTCLMDKAVRALLNIISSAQVGPYRNPSKGFPKPKGKDHVNISAHCRVEGGKTKTKT